MSNSSAMSQSEIKYSKLLSGLFCSSSILVLSILSLLNNLSLDLYSVMALLRVVVPGAFCFWFSGYVMGKIFENHDNIKPPKLTKLSESNEAYTIPSMFSEGSAESSINDIDGL